MSDIDTSETNDLIDCKCHSDNKCLLTETCCWCCDKRPTSSVQTYVDEYGFLGIDYIPRDISYCTNCRNTTKPLIVLVEQLRSVLPPHEYRNLQTDAENRLRIATRARLSTKMYRDSTKMTRQSAHSRLTNEHSYRGSMAGKSNRERRKGPQTRL